VTSALIIDDHPFALQGCTRILADAGIEPILAAGDLESGYALYQQNRPDVIMVGLAFADDRLAGLSLVSRIRAHDVETRIIVFSMHDDPAIVGLSLKAGASGYVPKDACSSELVKAARGNSNVVAVAASDLIVKTIPCQFGVAGNAPPAAVHPEGHEDAYVRPAEHGK
jgi:DNA-binding NarL/FixJ family response regulator